MRTSIAAITFICLCLSSAAFGQSAVLKGMVVDDKEKPVSNVRIITPDGQADETDSKGQFTIAFPAIVHPGQSTRIELRDKPGWAIYEPLLGNCTTQSVARNFEPLKVIIVVKGSLLALSPERISRVVARWTSERIRLRAQVAQQKSQLAEQQDQIQEQKDQLDEYAFLREYAEKYGFTLEQFRNAADQWAKINESDDKEERARKEYWRKNYDRAAQLARESGDDAVKELERAEEQRIEAGRKAIRRYDLEGDSFFQKGKFREAIAAYNKIEKLFSKGKIAKEDFLEEWVITKDSLGTAKWSLGTSLEGQESQSLLREAEMAYREVLKARIHERSSRWAGAQGNLGNALMAQGERSVGEESLRLLGNGVAAYHEALKVFTREQFPQEWASVQYSLGFYLRVQGERSSGEESMRLLGEAVSACREALKVYTREQAEWGWARIQKNLGMALRIQGERSSGEQSMRMLGEAIIACREALKVFEPGQLTLEWAMIQSNLGAALRLQSKRSSGEESLRLLAEAVVAHNEALKEHTSLLDDARITNELGPIRTRSGEEILRLLAEAITVCREALNAFTPDQLPQQWAATQYNLGEALVAQSKCLSEEEGMRLLAEAVTAYREALKGYTSKQFPQERAKTLEDLGAALRSQSRQSSGEEGMRLLGEAVTAYREALKAYPLDQFPKDWARTQRSLGAALRLQGERSSGEEGVRLLGEAVTAYREALKGYTLEQSQLASAGSAEDRRERSRQRVRQSQARFGLEATQEDLSYALRLQGERSSGEEGIRLLGEAVTAYREVLKSCKTSSGCAAPQYNLANALMSQSKRSSGEESLRLLAEAVDARNEALKEYTFLLNGAPFEYKPGTIYGIRGEEILRDLAETITACREALNAFTPDQLPQQWAATQYNLGNALRSQSKQSSGEEGMRLLAEAVTAYHEALKIFTREKFPQDWAKTQEDLGRTLMAQGERSGGAEGVRRLGEAGAAYREALKGYTLEQFPEERARTQYILGYTLRSQGERSSGEESIRLLGEAVTAYREALKGYSREKLVEQGRWAATQKYLGVALALQGERSGGAEGVRLLGEAITAYREALEVFTRERNPENWAETQDNLGKAYLLLKNWKDAAVCFENALSVPSYKEDYRSLASIYRDTKRLFENAFELRQKRLSRFPQDAPALADFAETQFTTGRFPEFSQRIQPLLTDPEFSPSSKVALRMIEVANLLALDNADQVPAALAALHKTISGQNADFRINWSFSGALNFINREERFVSYRPWLNQFFSAAREENRDAVLKALREAQAQFPAMNSGQPK
jgi:tetratricopeptide (TPR) repeat protein